MLSVSPAHITTFHHHRGTRLLILTKYCQSGGCRERRSSLLPVLPRHLAPPSSNPVRPKSHHIVSRLSSTSILHVKHSFCQLPPRSCLSLPLQLHCLSISPLSPDGAGALCLLFGDMGGQGGGVEGREQYLQQESPSAVFQLVILFPYPTHLQKKN